MPFAMVDPESNVELFYETHGAGRPLLAMHGGLGFDHSYLRTGLDPLGAQAQVVYYDHRGNGRSTRPDSLDAVNHDTWTGDADALRAALGHERMVLFGHSYGGFLALEYALRYPQRLAGLVLCGTAPVLDYPELMMTNAAVRASSEQIQVLQAVMTAPAPDDSAFRAGWETILPVYFHRLQEHHRAAFKDIRYSAQAYNAGSGRCLPAFNTLARLGEIRTPTLILSGRHDWITPVAQGGQRLVDGIPGSRLEVFEESGHYPFIEEPARFEAVMKEWLAGLGP